MIEYHARIHAPNVLQSVEGTRVHGVTWESEDFKLRMDEGVVYLEPEIDGHPSGAFFVGRGTVSFAPDGRKARRDMTLRFGEERVDDEPVEYAYFFTLRGDSLLDQLGIETQPAVSFDSRAVFAECKKAIRQLGTRLTHDFLNRHDLSEGAAYVLFAPPAIRTPRSPHAYLLYSFNPGRDPEIRLQAFGHRHMVDPYLRDDLELYPELKYYFWPIVRERSTPRRFVPEARAEEYSTNLTLQGVQDVQEVSTITLTTVSEVSALRLRLTPRLEVTAVTGPGDRALPFLQWKYKADRGNPDPFLLVFIDNLFQPGETGKITITASGPLIDGGYDSHYLAEEDFWHPRLNDPGRAVFELRATVPKGTNLVAAGELVSEVVEAGKRRYHYRTTRPCAATTFYFGEFKTEEATADDTLVTVHVDIRSPDEDLEATAVETANLVRVFNRILGPLGSERLRVVGTPVSGGSTFDGIILLDDLIGVSDKFDHQRARQVARLWWGDMVRPRDLPEDRWLSDSFAEYLAFEYLKLRYERPGREWMRAFWYKRVFWTATAKTQTLTGERATVKRPQLYALIDGEESVRSKGPLVLHSLRYLFEVRDGNDDAFWLLLQDFLDEHKYRRVSTREFLEIAEARYEESLDWFWDQWLFGTDLPVVRWSRNVRRTEDGSWLLTIEAEQRDTDMVLYIPIYIVTNDGETLREPLIMRGARGSTAIKLDDKPRKVSLNDDLEAIVKLKN